jgi:predicted GIY-YIG superfamily endonuclease
MSYVYLLVSTSGNTYVGATVDLNRRLRQHNKEIKGGAHATGVKVAQGETWTRAAHVSGFPDWQAALQFEWRWKQLTRKLAVNMAPLERRIMALKMLLTLPQSTSKAKPYADWPTPPEVHIETDDANIYYKKIFKESTENYIPDGQADCKLEEAK